MKSGFRILILALLSMIVAQQASAQEYSKFCKPEGKVSLFLVDRTTQFDAIDEGDIIQGLQRIYDQVGSGDRLIVHELGDPNQTVRPIFDACRPVCGNSFLDAFTCDTGSAKRADRSYTEKVVDRFRKLIRSREEHAASELLEGITLLTEEYRPLGLSKVYIFSDLLENSKVFGAEKLLDAGQTTSLLDLASRAGFTPSLKGVVVRAFGIGRWHGQDRRSLSLHERRALVQFWSAWFKSGGANSATITERYLSD